MFRGSVKSTGYQLHSPVSPSLPLLCFTVCHHVTTGVYCWWYEFRKYKRRGHRGFHARKNTLIDSDFITVGKRTKARRYYNNLSQNTLSIPIFLPYCLPSTFFVTSPFSLYFFSVPFPGRSVNIKQYFSTFVRPRPGKFFFHKTRALSQQIYS